MFKEDALFALGPCDVICQDSHLNLVAVGDGSEEVEKGSDWRWGQQLGWTDSLVKM